MPGSSTTPGRSDRAWCVRNVLPSALETASAPGDWLSRLNGWPMPSPTDASSASLRTPTHGSGPMWIGRVGSRRGAGFE
jgi:hypothetical protein